MNFLSNTRIKNKIIIIIFSVGAISVLTASVINYFYQVNKSKDQLIANTILQTKLMSEYCGLPMEFNYPDNATEVLEKLRTIPDVYNGILLTTNDSIFASYSKFKNSDVKVPAKLKGDSYLIDGDFIHVIQPVVYKGKNYGSLYLRSFMDWRTIIVSQLTVAILILLFMLLLIYRLAIILHKTISDPIVSLTHKMNIVAESKDYSTQFTVSTQDEIGELYSGFNSMMQELNLANRLQEQLYQGEKKLNHTLTFMVQKDWVNQEQMFTDALALFLAESLSVSNVSISRFTKKGEVLQTLTYVSNGTIQTNLSNPLKDNPAEKVLEHKTFSCATNAKSQFPKSSIFVNAPIESYVGVLLWDTEGKPLGLIDVYDTQQFQTEKIKEIERILQIVSVRAAHEIERKKIEGAFKRSEERYNKLLWSLSVPVANLDSDGRITFRNQKFLDLFGYSEKDMPTISDWWLKAYPDDSYRNIVRENWDEAIEKAKKENTDVESNVYKVTCADQTIREIIISGSFVGDSFVATFYDITDRITAEENFRKLNEDLEQMVIQRTHELLDQTKVAVKNEKEALKQKEIADKQRSIAEEQKEIAENSRKVKEQFLATMSHEIRTPLNAIIGFQALLRLTTLNTIQQQYLDSIDFASKNLLIIVNDVLDLSKIEAGKFEFTYEEIRIEQLLTNSIELIRMQAKEKDLKIFFHYDKMIPDLLVGDAARFNQIVLNLLSNALKFTEKGAISVTSKLITQDEEIAVCEFSISDTGIGIPIEKQKFIFDSFTQAEADTTRKYGGTGLGLSIVQRLLQLQNGTIQLKSETAKGSTFTFILPFKKKISSLHSSKESIPKNKSVELNMEKKNKKILLAEDYPLNQQLVMAIMEKLGHDLEIANNGQEAVDLFLKNEYDIILMDIQMPVLDGYHATKKIRETPDEKKRSIPIIAITANATQAETQKCLDFGMNACVTKPFNMDHLNSLIIKLTQKADE